MAVAMPGRSGTVVCSPSGERWTAEVRLAQWSEGERQEYVVSLNRTFPTEDTAQRAGGQVLAEWTEGDAPLRALLLKELAAAYRALREQCKTMQPPTVPATRSAWDRAISTWEERGWITAPDAARYREHVHSAFESNSGPVRRHRLAADPEAESTG
jgi:hypothetical protein